MDDFNYGRYLQICNCIRKWDSTDFTDFCLKLSNENTGRMMLSWICDHYDISYRAYLDIKK